MRAARARAVVLDTNALLMPFQFGINLDAEIVRLLGAVDVLVPSSVIEELDRLEAPEARAARALASKYKLIPTGLSGDEGVLDVARKHQAAVVTNDQEFIDVLKKSSILVVRMRGCQYLDFVE